MWIYIGTVKNSKMRKCCRFKVYKLAEKHRAKIRVGDRDGISYNSVDLNVKLFFKDEVGCEEFQTDMRQIPSQYRKRKPDDSRGDISVTDSIIHRTIYAVGLQRIWSEDYANIVDDESPSAECDTVSDVPSSYVSAVELTEDVKLRLLDNPKSLQLAFHKPEKCHLKSQSHFPEDRTNPNNILFMSRVLHEGFDGINQVEGVPDFALRYHGHNNSAIATPVGGGKQVDMYEVTVRVEFLNEDVRTMLRPLFKESTDVEGLEEIELKVCVPDPGQFKGFLDHKYANTLQRWASLAGVDT